VRVRTLRDLATGAIASGVLVVMTACSGTTPAQAPANQAPTQTALPTSKVNYFIDQGRPRGLIRRRPRPMAARPWGILNTRRHSGRIVVDQDWRHLEPAGELAAGRGCIVASGLKSNPTLSVLLPALI
jgi:hypothetical protein